MGLALLVQVVIATVLYFATAYINERDQSLRDTSAFVIEQRNLLQAATLFNFRLRILLAESPRNAFAIDMWRTNFSHQIEIWKKHQDNFRETSDAFVLAYQFTGNEKTEAAFEGLNKSSLVVLEKSNALLEYPEERLLSEKFRVISPMLLTPIDLMPIISSTNDMIRTLDKMSETNASLKMQITAGAGITTVLLLSMLAHFIIRPAANSLSASIKKEERTRKMLAEMASRDPLTQIGNRKALDDYFDQLQRGNKQAHEYMLFATIDLDRFKPINDSFGHEAGDQVLKSVANRLKTLVQEDDLLVRLGGDEFAIAKKNVHSFDEAQLIGQALVDAFDEPFCYLSYRFDIGASIGIAMCDMNEAELDGLMNISDNAMYDVKGRRRGTDFKTLEYVPGQENNRPAAVSAA